MNKEEKPIEEKEDSPTVPEQIVSDDDEIDYSLKPEFYDPKLDDKDELWVHKKRKGHTSDAVLSCPACFTTLCLDCQRHEKYLTQYRAMFVVNCKIKDEPVSQGGSKRKRRSRKQRRPATETVPDDVVNDEAIRAVCCAVCWTEVGIVDDEEVYHFFHVLPSES
ncbi:hypothetical protein M9H77_09365 [Catharanthus roseus]|uniref:Uncharacterized protein n=1 Tax=Catharanthus roseus TaxID=4058 RepID=A0ACC0C0I4_CATRO|nr:hypothetical protein M9H77_09365 [Catharanthus roseus]